MITIRFFAVGVGKTVIFPESIEEARAETRKLQRMNNVTAIEVEVPKADMYDDVQYVDTYRWSKRRNAWINDVVEIEKQSS